MGLALKIDGAETLNILEDNSSALQIANGSQWSPKTKHVATKYFAVRQDVNAGRVAVLPVDTHDNVSDIFTKPLQKRKFCLFRSMMGVRDVSCVL
jgi:hypothetical protein